MRCCRHGYTLGVRMKHLNPIVCFLTSSSMNTNVAPAAFWFFFETLRSPELFREASLEVRHSCITGHPQSIVVKDLVNRPLLSSIYAEVLRKYVAIMMIRETQQATEFGEWNVPKGQRVVVCSYTEHMDPQHWNTGSPSDPHPVKEFWGKRFLVPDTTPPKFEISGRAGTWIPYGQGERMCPGRHFTKTQMLLTFAKLMAEFDFELKIPNISSWNPKLNMSHFGFGALPPGERIPFRVRRRTA